MSESDRLLELIEEGLADYGGDLDGRICHSDGCLQIFDGRVTLQAELREQAQFQETRVHVHVLATLHEFDHEVLDACLFGTGFDRESALSEAAGLWVTCIACLIRSLIDGRAVGSAEVIAIDPQLSGETTNSGFSGAIVRRAYASPTIIRSFGESETSRLDLSEIPWFLYAKVLAAPRRVHLAKATVIAREGSSWSRKIEVDGHDASYEDSSWLKKIDNAEITYATRFAVFEFASDSDSLKRRAEIDRGIRHFATRLSEFDSREKLLEDMVGAGIDPDLAHEIETIGSLAFGRKLFEPQGVRFSPTVIRARRDGTIEEDVALMSIPTFARASALASELLAALTPEQGQELCCYGAESNAILQAIQAQGEGVDLQQLYAEIEFQPSVIPDRGVSAATITKAFVAQSNQKEVPPPESHTPWWKRGISQG